MALIYQVVDWDEHYENDRSRRLGKCRYVCLPNRQDGMGFARVMAEKDGAAIYGIWCLILAALSRQSKRAGWLTDSGEQVGSAWGADDLALRFRRPQEEVARALSVLTADRIGWIRKMEVSEEDMFKDNHHGITPRSPLPHPQLTHRREESRGEEKGVDAGVPPAAPAVRPSPSRCSAEEAIAFFAKEAEKMATLPEPGPIYTADEIRAAVLEFEAGALLDGRWKWGNGPCGDWRAALRSRMNTNRERRGGPGAKPRFEATTEQEHREQF